MMRKVVFLDRDGVINRDIGDYIYEPEKFHILPNVVEALKKLSEKGFEFVIVTNQGGIAKGMYTMRDVDDVHAKLSSILRKHDLDLLDIFASPHHDVICESLDRKPGSLMLERAIALHNIDPKQSYMIGDKKTDVQAAEGAGVKGLQIERNSPLTEIVDFLD